MPQPLIDPAQVCMLQDNNSGRQSTLTFTEQAAGANKGFTIPCKFYIKRTGLCATQSLVRQGLPQVATGAHEDHGHTTHTAPLPLNSCVHTAECSLTCWGLRRKPPPCLSCSTSRCPSSSLLQLSQCACQKNNCELACFCMDSNSWCLQKSSCS